MHMGAVYPLGGKTAIVHWAWACARVDISWAGGRDMLDGGL